MHQRARINLIVSGIVFTVVFCLTVRPVLNAADPESTLTRNPGSLADRLFRYANELGHALHERPLEERTSSDYRRALDAYGQVIRLNTDNYFSAESLARRAELLREMADATGDSALYQQAIEAYRGVVAEHPHSAFVGDALVGIAQVYEENLQDLDGASAAYRELISYFPSSALAREARAVLARFESQLGRRPVDVVLANGRGLDRPAGALQLTNIRNFGGPDYARVVIDLSDQARYAERRLGNKVSLQLSNTSISTSLVGRRFIVGDGSLLKRISVCDVPASSGNASGNVSNVQVDIEVGSLSGYSAFRIGGPERIVIDLHATGLIARTSSPARLLESARHSEITRTAAYGTPEARDAQPRARNLSVADKNSLKSLPEITDPILPLAPPDSASAANSPAAAAQALAARIDAKAAQSPIKRIVIDPGHGGHDTGTISPGGMREKDLVLDVGRRLRAYIKNNYPDVEVVMTRDSDRFVALEERTAIANSRRADLFISVHANASPSRAASGVETFFLSPDRASAEDLQAAARENARLASDTPEKPQPMFASVTVGNRIAESRELARYIQAGLVRGIGAQSPRTALNRGVKHAPFAVLLGAAMPSVLAEVSFLSNPKDEALLQTGQFRERVAASLFAGLNAYLKKNRVSETKPN